MLTFGPNLDGYHDVADQVPHAARLRAERLLGELTERKAQISSVGEFEAHRTRVREHFIQAIGGLPTKRTPMHAAITGTIERDGYTIEKLIYQSLPDFYVTCTLYLPNGIIQPAPAVLFVCGHSDLGKGYPTYQAVCVDLAQNGFVVLAMDPPGQGERFQYWDADNDRRVIGGCTTEHTYAGMQYVLRGASISRHFIWDAMRAIDYLETRPEVDPKRIAVTGNSGGGTQSVFLMVAEQRLAAAIPCTFVMTLGRYYLTGQAQDSEQLIAGAFVHGPDHDDYLTCMAPKPVLVGAVSYDFFPIEGALEAVERAKRIYKLYGAEDRVDIAVARSRHQYAPELRQAAVNFLRKHFQKREANFVTGSPETLPPEALNATPNGQVMDQYPDSKTLFDLGKAELDRLRPTPPAEPKALRQLVAQALSIDVTGRERTIYPRVISETEVDGYQVEKIWYFSEPDICVAGALVHPTKAGPDTQTDVLLLENGTNDGEAERSRIESLLRQGHRLFIFDPRGVGAVESRPFARGGSPHHQEYRAGCDAYMMESSTLGARVFDVLRAFDYLVTRDDVNSKRIGVHGVAGGAIWAYLAAALDERWCAVTCENMLHSYRDLASHRYYESRRYGFRMMAYGLLKHFDLADLLPAIAPRPTRFVRPRNHAGEPITPEEFLRRVVAPQKEAGRLRGAWSPVVE